MVTVGSLSAAFYLAKDGDRTIALTAERDGKLFCYVPNFQMFIYNKPLSVDFLIDRNHHYDRISSRDAAQIIRRGLVGRIDDRASNTLMEWATSEPQRLNPEDVFGDGSRGSSTNALGPDDHPMTSSPVTQDGEPLL
jgi:hypothetical protein